MKRLCWFWLLVFLLTPNVAAAGLIWQFTFGPDATNTLERGTLLMQLSPLDDAYDTLHLVNHFALNIDGAHYQQDDEAPGFTREWVDYNGATFDAFGQQWVDSGTFTGWKGTSVYLNLSDGGTFDINLSDFNGTPWSNSVSGAAGSGIVTSWRVLGVPEPETLSLMMAGLIALCLLHRRTA